MTCTTILGLVLALPPSPEKMSLLFVGNSLTGGNNMPQMVEKLLESDGSKRQVEVLYIGVGHLDDAFTHRGAVTRHVADSKYDIVILQGAMISQSLSREYSQEPGIKLTRMAQKAGSRVILYVEWPRKGVKDETEFSIGQYNRIRKATGAEMAPACYTWDSTLKGNPGLDLWETDGNHAKPLGSYIAAMSIYEAILGAKAGRPTYRIPGADAKLAAQIQKNARAANKRVKT